MQTAMNETTRGQMGRSSADSGLDHLPWLTRTDRLIIARGERLVKRLTPYFLITVRGLARLDRAHQIPPVQCQVAGPGNAQALALPVLVDKAKAFGLELGLQLLQDAPAAARQAAVGCRPVLGVEIEPVCLQRSGEGSAVRCQGRGVKGLGWCRWLPAMRVQKGHPAVGPQRGGKLADGPGIVLAEVDRVDRQDGVELAGRQVQVVQVADDKAQAAGLGCGAFAGQANGLRDVVQAGQERAGPVGQVFGDATMPAPQIQGPLTGAPAGSFDQGYELGQVGKAVLAQVQAKGPLADRAGGHGCVETLVEFAHRTACQKRQDLSGLRRT